MPTPASGEDGNNKKVLAKSSKTIQRRSKIKRRKNAITTAGTNV